MLTDTSTGKIRLTDLDRRRIGYWCDAIPAGVRTPEGLRRFAEQQKLLYPGNTPEEQLIRGLIDQSVSDILEASDRASSPTSRSERPDSREGQLGASADAPGEDSAEDSLRSLLQPGRIAALLKLRTAILGAPDWAELKNPISQVSNEG
ncbi:hypothetical protein [Solimonas sp. SE-A11]|uniref:hypothetical protein n=1 Tax=Solimonas sp. SE-A11 TaxID=3054954 RepID=UPI00259C9234|nr:hypothetical protein [Solimonas sp. SE-A11]MDM4770876.1 hypothetical protein [Solimonas sp. SE-A11]